MITRSILECYCTAKRLIRYEKILLVPFFVCLNILFIVVIGHCKINIREIFRVFVFHQVWQ